MHVECPNCRTVYEVPAIHFADGARRLRCTECGYRWNQTASDAELNEGKKSTPLLDMLEPAMNMEASAAINVDIAGDDGDDDGLGGLTSSSGTVASAALDQQAADDAYADIDSALAPMPAPTIEQNLAAMGRRWQWGLSLVLATVLLSLLILGRQSVASAAPFTQSLYRGLGLEPWSALRRWDLCLETRNGSELRYSLRNTSTFSRSMPDLYATDASGALALIDGPTGSLRAGEVVTGVAAVDGLNLDQPQSLALATKTDPSNARVYGSC